MISSVTTSTVTTVVTVATMVGLGTVLGLIAVITLISLLTIKELASAAPDNRAIMISRFSDIGIVPLLLVFTFIVAMQVWVILVP